MNKRKRLGVLLAVIFIISIAGYIYFQNNMIQTSHYTISDSNIPASFDEFKIVQISDLHNKEYGNQLLDKVEDEQPDIIVVTGDVIDRNRTNISIAINELEEMKDVAPIYFVSGNHEIASREYDTLKEELNRIGVENLDNNFAVIEKEGGEIGLIGMEDPLLLTSDEVEAAGSNERVIGEDLERLIEEVQTDYTVLLSHRAELLDVYAETSVNLALTGHAHGGQIRLPLINGLYSPSQGFFPEYTSGLYEQEDTKMIVSRGLGNSIFPMRINNRPDLVVVTLESE